MAKQKPTIMVVGNKRAFLCLNELEMPESWRTSLDPDGIGNAEITNDFAVDKDGKFVGEELFVIEAIVKETVRFWFDVEFGGLYAEKIMPDA